MNSSDGGDTHKVPQAFDDLEEQLLKANAEARSLPTRRQLERRVSRGTQIAVAISLLLVLLSVGWNYLNSQDIAENTTKAALTEQGLDSLEKANEALAKRGLPTIPVPKPGDTLNADAVAAAAAAMVRAQIDDDPSFRGPQGNAGEPGKPGEGGDTGDRGPGGPGGPEGQQGPGPSDQQVFDGVNRWCMENPLECQGPPGDNGTDGKDGKDGVNGEPGPKPVSVELDCAVNAITITIRYDDDSVFTDTAPGTFVC